MQTRLVETVGGNVSVVVEDSHKTHLISAQKCEWYEKGLPIM
jgi:hypothetical protein